ELAGAAGAERALEYARVVGRLHGRMTILPMRFGCFVRRREAAKEFLRSHEREFSEALATLEGCDEVGLRVLLPGSRAIERSDARTGTAYLADRRRYYERQALAERTCSAWAERARAAFAGMFRHSSWEHVDRPEGVLLSLSFLVEKSVTPAVLEACRKFRSEHAAEVASICTGPWPPYVFVAGLVKPETVDRAEREFIATWKG
ncbi:MAG TPA: GvpL/GvpF family gas vesicle protein, partial [Vulgatibacter sp.]